MHYPLRASIWPVLACLIAAQAALGQTVGYMKGTSWVATSVEGADQPFKVYQDPPTQCAFRLQMNYGEHSGEMGYAIQMTSLNCAAAPLPGTDLMTFYVDDGRPDEFLAFGINQPNNKDEVEEGQFDFSNDKRAFRLVRDLSGGEDPNVTRQRFRVRFNEVDEPTSGTLLLETRRGLNWETDATIELAPWGEKTEGVWGLPYGTKTSPLQGQPFCVFVRGYGWRCG